MPVCGGPIKYKFLLKFQIGFDVETQYSMIQ